MAGLYARKHGRLRDDSTFQRELVGALTGNYSLPATFLSVPHSPLHSSFLLFIPVSDTPQDSFQQKTNEELLFLTQNPGFYHADLVAAAQRELRARGVVSAAPAPPAGTPPVPVMPPAEPDRPSRLGLWVALGAMLLGGGSWLLYQQSAEKAAPTPASTSAKPRKTYRLVDAPTAALPTYDGVIARSIEQQLRKVPPAEKADAQALRQYRELAKRFWTAQTLTEYLTDQARQGKANEVFASQVALVQGSWQQLNKALVYSYKFGPIMADHLDRMSRVSRQQQEGLSDLPALVQAHQPVEDANTRERDADVEDLLSGLLVKSPVTGQLYKERVRNVRL